MLIISLLLDLNMLVLLEQYTDNALTAISSISRGMPRFICKICTHALIQGASSNSQVIDEEIIRTAALEAGL